MKNLIVSDEQFDVIREVLDGESRVQLMTRSGNRSVRVRVRELKERGRPRRKVRCPELDEVYDSITEAAAALGVSQPQVSIALRKGGTCGGYHVHYWEGEESEKAFDREMAERKWRRWVARTGHEVSFEKWAEYYDIEGVL